MASQEIETLTSALSRLPGLGPRSARRAVLWLVKHRESALPALLEALAAVSETLVECETCGNVDTSNPCGICADPRRDARSLCVVEEVSDVWALDRARLFPGRYHVLGGRLSARSCRGRGPSISTTRCPQRASSRAVVDPAGPAPITATSARTVAPVSLTGVLSLLGPAHSARSNGRPWPA